MHFGILFFFKIIIFCLSVFFDLFFFFMLDLAEKIGGDIGQYMDVKRSDVLAIRSLQQIPKPRPHRKLADF